MVLFLCIVSTSWSQYVYMQVIVSANLTSGLLVARDARCKRGSVGVVEQQQGSNLWEMMVFHNKLSFWALSRAVHGVSYFACLTFLYSI